MDEAVGVDDEGGVGRPSLMRRLRVRDHHGPSSRPSTPHSCEDFQSCGEPDPSHLNGPPSPSLSAEVFNGVDVCSQELHSSMAMDPIIAPDLDSNLVMELSGSTSIELDEGHLVMGSLRNDFVESSLAEEEVKGHEYVAAVMAELERERQKNIELLGRVSSLEAKLGGEDGEGRPTIEPMDDQVGVRMPNYNVRASKTNLQGSDKHTADFLSHAPALEQDGSSPMESTCDRGVHPSYESIVNWMCKEEVSRTDIEKLNDAGSGDDDDDDDEDDNEDENNDHGNNSQRQMRKKARTNDPEKVGTSTRIVDSDDSDGEDTVVDPKVDEQRRRGEGRKTSQGKRIYWSKRYGYGPYPVGYRGAGILSSYKKAPKFPLTPMEVKRILESGVLSLKNAQSHTMRKIIVFSCLCIHHGCEDFYELDINHFKILQRGQPYRSLQEPGEHILYSHPSGRSKVFYPNHHNPILCPVHIIDEEKEMRPAGASTPSCLFLCIKYGGRTRNLPQNQYVRQRMGRNKLKSFGPLMCQMALLVHVCTGSFFFKALGITLLFMAGFSDDQVRQETKYRNLDLLQKYYRPDEAARGEQLFHPYPAFFPQAPQVLPASQTLLAAPIAPAPMVPTPVSQGGITVKKPPPLLVRKDLPVLPLVSAKPKPSADRPYRRIPPLPFHLMKAPKRGRKPKNLEKLKLMPLGPPPFGIFPRYPPVGYPPMPPPGWRPGNGFPPGAFPFPFPPFPPNPQTGSTGLPPFFPHPYGFPPFMMPPLPPTTHYKSTQPKEEAGPSDNSGSDSGSTKLASESTEHGELGIQ